MPASYSEQQRKEIGERLCRGIAAGLSVAKCCALEGMPSKDTIFQWLMEDKDLSDQYARAREHRADARSERIDEITNKVEAGTLGPNEARVIIDAEKWQAGKENAKRYGDKLDLTSGGATISDANIDARLSHLLRKAGTSVPSGGEGAA